MTTFEFGDFVDEDSADTAEPEAGPTSRIFQNYAHNVYREPEYNDLSDEEKVLLLYIFTVIVKVHYGLTAEAGAIVFITLARKFSGDVNRPRWDQLSRRLKNRQIALMEYILKRLARETDTPWDRG